MKQILLTVVVCLATFNVFAQGNLTPTAAPAATMKTLSQIEPRTPISSLPYNITTSGAYYVTTNLAYGGGGYGILINANNIDLDLGGFTLQGALVNSVGISFPGAYTNVTVRHGIISGWHSFGIDALTSAGTGNGCNWVFEDLKITGNGGYGLICAATNAVVRNCLCSSNASTGLYISGGIITGCQSVGNKSTGIEAFYSTISDSLASANGTFGFIGANCNLINCNAQHNGSDGFNLSACDLRDSYAYSCGVNGISADHSSVRNCTVQSCANYGVGANASVVSGCFVQNNLLTGIYVNSPGCEIIGNLCTLNNVTNNAAAAGIFINDANNRVEDNHLSGNGVAGYGLYVNPVYANNSIVKNSVVGNSTKNYSVGTLNDVGPIGSATNSTSPWANLSR